MELWTVDDIASCTKAKVRYVRDKLTKHPSFPRPVPMPGMRGRRWDSEEVVAWFERAKEKRITQ